MPVEQIAQSFYAKLRSKASTVVQDELKGKGKTSSHGGGGEAKEDQRDPPSSAGADSRTLGNYTWVGTAGRWGQSHSRVASPAAPGKTNRWIQTQHSTGDKEEATAPTGVWSGGSG